MLLISKVFFKAFSIDKFAFGDVGESVNIGKASIEQFFPIGTGVVIGRKTLVDVISCVSSVVIDTVFIGLIDSRLGLIDICRALRSGIIRFLLFKFFLGSYRLFMLLISKVFFKAFSIDKFAFGDVGESVNIGKASIEQFFPIGTGVVIGRKTLVDVISCVGRIVVDRRLIIGVFCPGNLSGGNFLERR